MPHLIKMNSRESFALNLQQNEHVIEKWEYLEDPDEFLSFLTKPEAAESEFMQCVDIREGIGLLGLQHNAGLDPRISKVFSTSERAVYVKSNIPRLTEAMDIKEFEELVKGYGKIEADPWQLKDEDPDGYESGLHSVSSPWGCHRVYQWAPGKRKAKEKQYKYYKRRRFRTGDIPIDIFSGVVWQFQNFLSKRKLPAYMSGLGSRLGAESAANALFEGFSLLGIDDQLRMEESWKGMMERASHYVSGCIEYKVYVKFAHYIHRECKALEIDIPQYVKGKRYD